MTRGDVPIPARPSPYPARRYFVGLGSNIDPCRNMSLALDRLLSRFGAVEVSRILETAPVGPMEGMFLNAVASFETELPAAPLKELLCGIEAELGRDRSDPARARHSRPIDLDILIDLPASCRDIPSPSVPAEAYYRPSALELIGILGLSCPVQAVAPAGATEIRFGAGQIGLEPASLVMEPDGRASAARRRAALVTGGAVRLGKEIALALARAGYDIALHYNASAAEAERTAELCRVAGVRCEVFAADFMDSGALPRLMDAAADRFPHLDLLVNSASVYEPGAIAATTPALLDRQWSVNFKAPFLLMKEFARRVGRGAIVNVLDNKIAFNQFEYAAYLTAKKALADATKMAALEFAPHIRVNGIAPGVILPGVARDEAYLAWRREAIPVGRLGDPGLLCDGLMMLVTNGFISGHILFVDGGEATAFTGRSAPVFTAMHDPTTIAQAV